MLRPLLAATVLVASGAPARAYEFRARFVERIANVDMVIGGSLQFADPFPHRVRVQFGVFDSPSGPAPAGGLIGWNVGTITVSGGLTDTLQTRTPGRLNPFNFATQPGANGNPPLPGGDPFLNLTDIDATLGTQSPLWVCTPDGQVPPQPDPVIRGRNTFVSVFELTIRQPTFAVSIYTLTFGGNLIAATEWRPLGRAPDCGDPADPGDDIPGSITYAPFPTAPQAFTASLQLLINEPAPGTGLMLSVGALLLCRRRRVCPSH